MRKALIFAPARGFPDAIARLRLQETVHAVREDGWDVDIVTAGGPPPVEGGEAGIFSPPLLLRPRRVPDRPSFRGIYAARLMFLRALPLASSGRYSVFHGFDDGASVARAVCRATVRRHPVIAEYRNPVSTADGPIGLCADIMRRREQSAIRHACAVVVPDEAMLARFEKPPAKARVCVIPDPQSETNSQFFTVAEFEAAVRQVYEFAAIESDRANASPEDGR